MAYADFDFYRDSYFGDALTKEDAAKWLSRASDELDSLTFGRLTNAFPTVEAHAEKVRKAVCAIADTLFFVDVQRMAASAQKTADGSYRGAVASVSSGRESISFSTNGTATAYAAAVADPVARVKLISSIAVKYLANVPDSTGVNLLYAGGVKRVPECHYHI